MLSYADYIVLAVALLISASIGIYYRRQTNANDYLLAGGTMSPLPVAFSLMASFMSAITLLGVTNENFAYGTQFIVINISYAIGKVLYCIAYELLHYMPVNTYLGNSVDHLKSRLCICLRRKKFARSSASRFILHG